MPPGYDKSDPADPYTLLGPDYHGRLPGWGIRDYRDPTLIAGRSLFSYTYLTVLLLAAGADIGAFFQIVELVLPQDPLVLVYVVVLGFTATALALAHKSGSLFRDHLADAAWASLVMPVLCIAAWLLLGGTAFYARLTLLATSLGSGSLNFSVVSGPSHAGAGSVIAYQSAIVFLALYLATGLVTWMGAYQSRNPVVESYRRTARAYIKARDRADVSSARADSAEAILGIMRAELAAAEMAMEREVRSRRALAEKLRLTAQANRTSENAALTAQRRSRE